MILCMTICYLMHALPHIIYVYILNNNKNGQEKYHSMNLIKRPITYTFPFRLLLPLRCSNSPASYRFLTQSLSPRRFPQPIIPESLSDPFSIATPNHSSCPCYCTPNVMACFCTFMSYVYMVTHSWLLPLSAPPPRAPFNDGKSGTWEKKTSIVQIKFLTLLGTVLLFYFYFFLLGENKYCNNFSQI